MSVTRRGFIRTTGIALGAASIAGAQSAAKKTPIGLELYSVRTALAADPMGTVKKVAAMGYQVVEFYGTYYTWTLDQAKEMKKLLDDLGIVCHSTHNGTNSFQAANLQKTIDLNKTIGGSYVVLASSISSTNPDDWKKLAVETLGPALETLRAAGLHGGYHNHQAEFKPMPNGQRPMDVLAANTPKDFALQLDIGTCVEVGQDPIAWVKANPGRIKSLHLKEWSKDKGYTTLYGEGEVPWKPLLNAAETTGGAEYFLIEQEGSRFSEFESAQRCLDSYKKSLS